MDNPSLVIVLAEDQHHEMLIRRYLRQCGVNKHEIRINRSPSGQGNAEGWVRREFVKEIRAYRVRQARARTSLIVIIDADVHTVEDRLVQLNRALTDLGEEAVRDQDRVARLVPKRNVETWILCLNDEPGLDEDTDYTRERRHWHDMIPPAARMLCQWTQSPAAPPAHCLSSLQIGVHELRRIRA